MDKIIIHEVSLRDGLQMEKQIVPTEQKLKWIYQIMDSGIDIIQLGSFVHPEKVPQMADTDKLFLEIKKDKKSKTILSGLVLNEKGLERGEKCGVEMYCMGVSASETHSMKNTGMSTSEATERIINTAKQAIAAGKKCKFRFNQLLAVVSKVTFHMTGVLTIIQKYLEAGLKNIHLPIRQVMQHLIQVEKLYEAIFKLDSSIEAACHFHNTYGMGLANVYAAMKIGVQNYESSIAGLGGCPFTKVAAGNVCTEDFVHGLQRMGYRKRLIWRN
jgi:hydroxymethylglutaryl-CoA lyase